MSEPSPSARVLPVSRAARRLTVGVVLAGAAAIGVLLALMVLRSEDRTNKIALASQPQSVTTVSALGASYVSTRTYVGTLEPWTSANIGPQFVSAYVESVRVRPGALVKRGDILATLDCRDVDSATQAVAAGARATDARQQALAHQLNRMNGLLAHGFVSTDDLEQKSAQSQSETEKLASQRAQLSSMKLEVADCVLRAPFDGEVTARTMDPGSFARPGAAVIALTDRHIVRYTADVPEDDFRIIPVDKQVRIHVDALGLDLEGTISRRTPSADPDTRTVHFEVDLENPDRAIPVNTTGVATLDVGDPVPAAEIPLRAATVRNGKAVLFTVDQGVAHQQTVPVLGERAGVLFLDGTLHPGTAVVTEGRTMLTDGDKVAATRALFEDDAASHAADAAALRKGVAQATVQKKEKGL